ncbi:MAG TPA: DNA polymerase III subunit delta [Armatimonadota bacterium]
MTDTKPTVYILYGDDEYAISQYLAAMYSKLGDPSTADLNFTKLDGKSASDNELRNATNTIPFLADRRIVILTHPFARMPDGHKKTERAIYQQEFLKMLDGLPETTALVLVVEDQMRYKGWETLKEDHWLMQWARKAEGRVMLKAFALPTGIEMQRWVMKTATALGGEFSLQAAAQLVELIGSDTRLAALEIDKVLTYVNRTRPVSRADVEALTTRVDQPDIFALVDALGARDGKEASTRLHVLLEEQDAFSIFGMVVRQFRLLILTREVLDMRGGQPQVEEALRGEPFRVTSWNAKKLIAQAQKFSMAELEEIYRRLLGLDETFKSSQMEASVALDLFIADLVNG